MFTGLVEAIGTCTAVDQASPAAPRRLTLRGDLDVDSLSVGDSVALDGCCLTVVARQPARRELTFEATTETLQRTRLGTLQVGGRVNMERALRLGDRLGGHLVSGHVDGLGRLVARQQKDSALYLTLEAAAELIRYVAPRGSITVDGVSLTVTGVQQQQFDVALIPHTLSATTLGDRQVGQTCHLEADMLARYVDRLLQAGAVPPTAAP